MRVSRRRRDVPSASSPDAPPQQGVTPGEDRAGPGEVALAAAGTAAALGVAAGERLLALGGVGAGLAVLALVRFELFVLTVLVVRASLDAAKAGSAVEPTTAIGAAVMVLVVAHEALQRLSGGGGRRPLSAPFRLPLQVFLAASVVSALGSDHVAASLQETLRLAGVVAMLLALERVMDREASGRRVLIAFFLSAVVPLAVAARQLTTDSGRDIGGFTRITGTFLHPNPFSIYLAMIIVMAVALLPWVTRRARWSLLLLASAAGVCMLFTYTRGSWIALVLGLLVVGILQSRALVAAVVAATLGLLAFVPAVSARFADLETDTRYSGAAGNSFVWRTDYWREILTLSEGSPLTGIGLKGITRSTESALNAHNDLVRVYVETGVLGLAAYLALAVTLVITARRALRATERGWPRGVAVGFSAVLAVLAVVSVSSNVITQVVLLWYVVAVAVVAVAVSRPPDRDSVVLPAETASDVDRRPARL